MKTRMFLFLAAATLLLAAGCRSIPLPEGVIPAEKMTQTPARPEPVEPLRRLAASGDPDGTFRYGLQLLFAENSRQPVEKPEFPNGVPFGIRPENWSPADLWIARAAQLGSPEAKYYTAAARQAASALRKQASPTVLPPCTARKIARVPLEVVMISSLPATAWGVYSDGELLRSNPSIFTALRSPHSSAPKPTPR